MRVEEKIGQLAMVAAGYAVTGPVLARGSADDIASGLVGGVLNLWGGAQVQELQRMAVEKSRLGIPLLIGLDVLHGHKTIFPIPLAEAATFDPQWWEQGAREAAIEAAADGISLTFAPMLDVARDPRWGRIAESPGEDPWVAAAFAKAKVMGFQGGGLPGGLLNGHAVAATAKHLCAYGAALAGRDYASADVSERFLREVYLPPFAAAIAAGCAAIMPAFNDVAGIPMTIHVPLLRDWLRRETGFDGVIISDYNAIGELISHGVAGDLAEAAAMALRAGVDVDMMSGAYSEGLPLAIERGLVTPAHLDAAVRRVLRLKERLGLFDDPYRRGVAAPALSPPPREFARDIARRSVVLLANNGVLPLSQGLRRIAVIGPLADARADMLGPWALAGNAANVVPIREGLAAALPSTEFLFEPGVTVSGQETSGIKAALDACRSAELSILCLGEAANMSGEAASRANPLLPGAQAGLAQAVLELGKPAVIVLSSGRPLILGDLSSRADAVLATWFLGVEAGHAIADVLTGNFNPSGRLPITWPRDVGQVPIFFAERPSGRPAKPDDRYTSKYLDIPNEPLFPFGHGLSYCRFSLANLRSSHDSFTRRDELRVEVDVTNEGPVVGEATIFLFVRDIVASVTRPLLELKGTAKICLGAKQSGCVRFNLPGEAFVFPGLDLQPVFEAGEFLLFAGQSADPRGLLAIKVLALAD